MARTPARRASAIATAAPTRRAPGRPRKEKASIVPAVPTSTPKRRGRPPKDAVVDKAPRPAKAVAENAAPTITKRRGRPPKNASSTASVAKPVTPRIDPRVRSKLRARVPKAEKPVPVKEVSKPAKRRGRPPKASTLDTIARKGSKAGKGVRATNASKAKKTRKATKASKTKAPTARVIKSAPRKKRGYTNLEVPDKFAAQVQQYLLNLQAIEADEIPAVEEVGEEEEEQHQMEEDGQAGVVSDDIQELNGLLGAGEDVLPNHDQMDYQTFQGEEGDQPPVEVLYEEEIIEQIQT